MINNENPKPYATLSIYGGKDKAKKFIRCSDLPIIMAGAISTYVTEREITQHFDHVEHYPKVFISTLEECGEELFHIDIGYNIRITCNQSYLDAIHNAILNRSTYLQYEAYLKANHIGTTIDNKGGA